MFWKGGNIGSDNIAAKIIEFSKKIRDLNAELGKEKTKSNNLRRHVDILEQEKKVSNVIMNETNMLYLLCVTNFDTLKF